MNYILFLEAMLSIFSPPPVHISRETTFIEAPLHEDGTPDYVGALNLEWSRGVTPENNGAVLMLEALGPGVMPIWKRESYFQGLGMPVPPEEGPYLLDLATYLRSQGITQQQIDELPPPILIPFTPAECPEIAAWIEAMVIPAAKLTAASQREQFFTPLILEPGGQGLRTVQLSEYQQIRSGTRLLALRPMLRLGTDDHVGACDDAITLCRLGRQFARGPLAVEAWVGWSVVQQGLSVAEELLLSQKLTLQEIRQLRSQLQALPPLPDLTRCFNFGERLCTLDSISREGYPEGSTHPCNLSRLMIQHRTDLNVALRRVNRDFDRLLELMSETNWHLRAEELKSFRGELLNNWQELRDKQRISFILWGKRDEVGDFVGINFSNYDLSSLLEFPSSLERVKVSELLLSTGAAVVEFRASTGEDPDDLQQLVPHLLERIPTDPYSDEPIRYQRHSNGFQLYSVGPDGIDDGGRKAGESEEDQGAGDDIRFGTLPDVPDA